MIGVGTRVTFVTMPAWVTDLPEESQRVFRFCLGRTYPVVELDHQGLYVLDVSADIDHRFGGYLNDIHLEATFLREASSSP